MSLTSVDVLIIFLQKEQKLGQFAQPQTLQITISYDIKTQWAYKHITLPLLASSSLSLCVTAAILLPFNAVEVEVEVPIARAKSAQSPASA